MHATPSPQTHITERRPIPCALYSATEGLHEEGTILNLGLTHCHVESAASLVPGMTLALFVILPGTSHAVVMEEALVTWVRGGECGLRLYGLRPEDAMNLETYLRKIAARHTFSPSPGYALAGSSHPREICCASPSTSYVRSHH